MTAPVGRLDELAFDNRFTAELAGDAETANVPRQVHHAWYTPVQPTPVAQPVTLAWSAEVADLLGLDPELCRSADFAAVFAGNRLPAGAEPYASCYGGHQFGSWAGQLGDGRAIALGEVLDRHGDHQTLQLKGAGPTPYSRSADGRAVLRSSIREFLCSEAMHHLGVPTTRALSLVATGEPVVRDMLYDGHPRPEPGAVVCRVAPSFTRFGHFQLAAARGDLDLLRGLVTHTVGHHFPQLAAGRATFADQLGAFFQEVCQRTAALVVQWMRVGFVHGVLNTDNMSILGLTIDYGPYGWLESFDPDWTPNTTDAAGHRYCYGAQPQIGQWNLTQLARALVTLTGDAEVFEAGIERYRAGYHSGFAAMMAERLGWLTTRPGDDALVDRLFDLLGRTETDQVLWFRDLAGVPVDPDGAPADDQLLAPLARSWYRPEQMAGEVRAATVAWLRDWARRVMADTPDGDRTEARRRRMDAVNPRFVLRNSLAQEVIDAAEQGDLSLLSELAEVLRRPYNEQPGRERWSAPRPEWARHRVGCSMLSCSS